MELKHTFTVPASLEDTWKAFSDLEMVAGCFPGASVTSVEGDSFTGTAKVKLGPIAMQYSGSGSYVERDEAAHRFVLEAKGKDKRGQGTAGATVTATLTAAGPESTDAEVLTDLSITGKPAQFGRGVIQDVSDKLLGDFISCLESKLAGPAEAPTAEAAATPVAEPTTATEAAAAAPTATATAGAAAPEKEPTPRTASAPRASAAPAEERQEPEALDLGATVLPILLKSYWKQLAAGFVVVLVLWRVLRRRK